MTIAMITAAAGTKQVIGKDGDLPWHFSSDLKFFKEKTSGTTVLMGRVSYDSILHRLGKPLPNRHTVVLTRDTNFKDDRIEIIHNIGDYLTQAPKEKLLYVIGGAAVYALAIPYADELYITHIEAEIEGDTFFPPIDPMTWRLAEERVVTENDTALRFCHYVRRAAA